MNSETKLSNLTVPELLQLHSSAINELRSRGVLRSENNPTGDYAEWLVARRLGYTLATNSVKGYDATDTSGVTYQIKARRITSTNSSAQLSAIRSLQEKHFDYLIGVVFDENWRILRAVKIPHSEIENLATYRAHVNAHVMHLPPNIIHVPGVQNITTQLSSNSGDSDENAPRGSHA